MQLIVHPGYVQAERIVAAMITAAGWIFAWLLLKCLERISKIDEDCFI